MILQLINKRFCLFTISISIAALIGALSYLKYSNNTCLTVYPSPTVMVNSISDTSDGGNSLISLTTSDSSISFLYQLQPGFNYPYSGIKLTLTGDKTSGLNFSKYDNIHIKLKMSNSDAIRIFLKSYDPGITDTSKPNTYWYHEKEYVPAKYPDTVSLSLNSFAIPIWWQLEHNITVQKRLNILKSVNHIEILNGLSTSPQDTVKASLSTIYLTGKNRVVEKCIVLTIIFLWIITLIIFSIFAVNVWRKRSALQSIKSNALSAYKKISLKPDDEQKWDRLMLFISENYFDPQLNIELLSFKTGINRKSISYLIQKFMNSNFKGYLNQLRLQEAARLLKETDKQITEIAISVGYNNISHFSRIFKEKFDSSPKDFREKQV